MNTESRYWPMGLDARQGAMITLLVAVVACKAWLNLRININWDEFHYLSQIGGYQRGEHIPAVQTLHVRLFGWLTGLQAQEVGQVLVARFVMAIGLLATVVLLWKLATIWVEGWVAWVAPLVYLLASPVFRHGNSFRPDSILAPAITCAVFLLCRMPRSKWAHGTAGVLFGVAGAVSIKAILALPMILGVIGFSGWSHGWRAIAGRVALVGTAALSAFLLIVSLQGASMAQGIQSDSSLVAAAIDTTIFNKEIFPTMRHFRVTWVADRLVWLLMGLGLLMALLRRQYVAATLALSLLPLLFYRNAFPYYYVVMLAPATVLASIGVDSVARLLRLAKWHIVGTLFFFTLWLSFAAKFEFLATSLSADRVSHQSAVVAAVHHIFPEPVPYIDHSGMIASFPKVAPFMSTWGIAKYVEAGKPFMPDALVKKPPLLLVNAPVLSPKSKAVKGLLPADRDILAEGYLHYWGPVFVAGTVVVLDGDRPSVIAKPPYSGRYRVFASGPVHVNGVPTNSGETVDVPAEGIEVGLGALTDTEGSVRVELFDARARPQLPASLASRIIYDPL